MVASPDEKNAVIGLLLSIPVQLSIPDEANGMIRQALHGS